MIIDGSDPTPKYHQLRKHLADQIASQRIRVGDQLPSEDELARKYSLSRNTVRQALEHLDKEGYIERSHGRGTFVIADQPRRSSSAWMVIVPDIRYPVFPELIRSIEDVAREHGISLILGNSDYRPEQQLAYIERALHERLAGVALSPLLTGDQNAPRLNALKSAGIPLVFLVRGIPGVEAPQVVCRNRLGGYLATKHLTALGHRRIGYLSWPRYTVNLDRFAGHLEALQEAGIPEREEYVRFAPDPDPTDMEWPEKSDRFVVKTALEMLEMKDPPTALFVPRDLTAFLVYQAIEDTGRRIPDDVSLVGFDALPSPEFVRGRLTSIAYPKQETGAEAARLLLALSEGENVPSRVELAPTLVEGNSTRAVTESPSRRVPKSGGRSLRGLKIST